MTSPPANADHNASGGPEPGQERPAAAPAGQAAPVPAGQAAPVPAGQPPAQHVVKRTRVGAVWVASALFALVLLLLLLIFILENSQKVDISFFGAHGHLPLGVALLLAAVLGVLLVVIPGTGRIIQLRMVARRHRRAEAAPAEARVAANPGSAPAGAGDPAA